MYLLTKSAKCVAAYKKEVRQYARNCAYDAIWREFYELTEGALEAFFENADGNVIIGGKNVQTVGSDGR